MGRGTSRQWAGRTVPCGVGFMPIHAWSKTDAGLFHHFHQRWIGNLCDGLNAVLPPDYFALSEMVTAGTIPDVLTLERGGRASNSLVPDDNGGIKLANFPPRTRFIRRA